MFPSKNLSIKFTIFRAPTESMRKLVFYAGLLVMFAVGICNGHAQLLVTDSLEGVLKKPGLKVADQVGVLIQLSDLYLSRNPDRSFFYTRQAVALATPTQNPQLIGPAYRSLGNYYSDKGDLDSSTYFLEQALEYIPHDALTYFFLGQNEWFNGKEKIANTYYALGEKAALQNADLKTLAIIYHAYAEYYRYYHDYAQAQHYISLSIRILEKSSLYSELAVAYNIQVEIYRTQGDYKKALETCSKMGVIAYQIVDSNRIGYCLSRMGYIYYMQNDFKTAELYLLKSLELSEKTNSRNLRLFSLKALADMYSNQVNVAQCKLYAGLCLQAGIEMNNYTGEALAYSALSNLYYRIHNNDSALWYADKAYWVAKKNDDPINMLNAILNKIPLAYETGSYIKVVQLTKEGIELAEVTKTKEHLKDLYKYEYLANEQLGNNAEAFVAYKKFKIFEDSLSNADVSLGVHKSQLEMSYQDKHLADTLLYIKKNQEARDAILLEKQRGWYLTFIGVLMVSVLSLVTFIIWLGSRKRKKLNDALTESNLDKERLLKEIHHRVKNSLQTVSSLLNLQKNKAGLQSFEELIDESQLKISNIASVHELLYQSASFRKIDLSDYVDKLLGLMYLTFTDKTKKIVLKKDIEHIEISLDKSVPLALIINEIITNSFKYAFEGRTSGTITITCKKEHETVTLDIRDNGIGLLAQPDSSSGLGFALIKGFVQQLKGTLNYGTEHGSFFVISFPDNSQV
jgi:two-component sensor histidine kinase